MNSPYSSYITAHRVRDALFSYDSLLSTVGQWAHPSWFSYLHTLLGSVCASQLADSDHMQRLWYAVFSAYRSTEDSAAKGPHVCATEILLAWVGETEIRTMCLLRALAFRRIELRRLVDKKSRARLLELAPIQVIDRLCEIPSSTNLGTVVEQMPSVLGLDRSILEWEGMCLLLRENVNAIGLAHLWRWKFERQIQGPAWILHPACPLDVEGAWGFASASQEIRELIEC